MSHTFVIVVYQAVDIISLLILAWGLIRLFNEKYFLYLQIPVNVYANYIVLSWIDKSNTSKETK